MATTGIPTVSPYVWGSDAWDLIHAVSFLGGAPSLVTKWYLLMLRNLPCEKCRAHAAANFKRDEFNAALKSDTLIEFWFTFHNKVNRMLGKPTTMTMDDLCNKYTLRGALPVSKAVLARYARIQWLFTPAHRRHDAELGRLWVLSAHLLKLETAFPKPKMSPLEILSVLDPKTSLRSIRECLEDEPSA